MKCDSGPLAAQCGGVKAHACSGDNSSGRMKGCIHGASMAVEAKGKEWYLPEQNQLCLIFCVFPKVLIIQQLLDTFPLSHEIINIQGN